ncbi:ZIP family metal transporter [[Mycoplasma] mobile]|uniref:Expressed protein n=1 Tax=Mycoplasma mobile (strain ATCC 43663 / 163K / NCTC 11711) TaxID=267748 RepID=Q6KIL3_MYCM1|nr:ZIP family metal transporter [[Mycoplasma] mobile]AAT27563.1 expressed protein [Mycoplasma mobile 163K]
MNIENINFSSTTSTTGIFGPTSAGIGIIATIISVIVVGFPLLLGFLLPIIKPKLKKTTMTYMYALTAGYFVILGLFILFIESSHFLNLFTATKTETVTNPNTGAVTTTTFSFSQGEIFGIRFGIIGMSFILVLTIGLIIKYFISKKLVKKESDNHKNGIHEISHGHNHGDGIFNLNDVNPKAKMYALILIVMHKIPAALTVGFFVSQYANNDTNSLNLIFLITFLLHIIPEELIFYYRQIDMGVSKWKAASVSALFSLIFVPFLFIGAYSANQIKDSLAIPFILAAIGALLVFTALVEFIPELLHEKLTIKMWYRTIIALLIGMAFGVVILLAHELEPEVAHNHSLILEPLETIKSAVMLK